MPSLLATTKVFLDMFLAMQLLLQLLRGAAADRVPAVIVFGDSTADTGNNNFIQTLLRGNYTPYGRDFAGGVATGRFSNGRVPTDFVGSCLHLHTPLQLEHTKLTNNHCIYECL